MNQVKYYVSYDAGRLIFRVYFEYSVVHLSISIGETIEECS